MRAFTFVVPLIMALLVVSTSQAQEPETEPAQPLPPPPAAEQPHAQQKADAPSRLTLEECLRRALASSRRLMAERHRLAMLDAQVKQVYWAPFSEIGFKGFFTVVPNRKNPFRPCTGDAVDTDDAVDPGKCLYDEPSDDNLQTGDDWGPALRLEATAAVPLYTFNKIKNSRQAIEAAYEAKQAELPRFENEIKLQVRQAYEAILGGREMLYTVDQGRSYLSKARKTVEQNLEKQEGTSTEIDLIKLKVIEAQVGQLEAQAREIERVGLAGLRFLIGANSGQDVDVVDLPQTAREEQLGPLSQYVEQAIDMRPELAALRKALEAMRSKVKLRKSEFFPNLALLAGWRFAYAPGRDDIKSWVLSDSFNYGPASFWFGLGLEYKLDVGLDIFKLNEAKAELAALSAESELALDAIVLEVSKTYEHAAASRAALDSLYSTKKLVKGWIAATAMNHAAGLASTKDMSDALKEYFSTMANVLKTTADLNISLAELERVTASPLESPRADK
ncbi:MAG: TolC family protein [Myxococcota bacterium]|jgi:outer membrane protein TolC|nr:TolC family protein [Myxococcota bacterium]